MSAERYAYIGRAPGCGCIRAVVVDEPTCARITAKDIAGFVRSGLHVERVAVESVLAASFEQPDCAAHKPQPGQTRTERQVSLL